MNRLNPGARQLGRLAISLTLGVALAGGAVACSSGTDSPQTNASSVAPDAKIALTALDAGLKAHAAGDLAGATTQYNRTLKYDKTNKFAFYNLALIDNANANYGLAEQKYRQALKTDAKYSPALFNLAILRTSADPKEAIALYERAVAVNKKDASALLNLGLLLRANGQKAAGDKDVSLAIALNPRLNDPAGPVKGSGVKKP